MAPMSTNVESNIGIRQCFEYTTHSILSEFVFQCVHHTFYFCILRPASTPVYIGVQRRGCPGPTDMNSLTGLIVVFQHYFSLYSYLLVNLPWMSAPQSRSVRQATPPPNFSSCMPLHSL